MMIIWIAAFVAVAAAQPHDHGNHGHNNHNQHQAHPNQHAIENQLRHSFQAFDTDGDGVMSLAESNAAFNVADTNGDGNVTLAEYLASRATEAHGPVHLNEEEQTFLFEMEASRIGTVEGHGVITREDAEYFFNLTDGNGDGYISVAELEAAIEQDIRTFLANLYAIGLTLQSTTVSA